MGEELKVEYARKDVGMGAGVGVPRIPNPNGSAEGEACVRCRLIGSWRGVMGCRAKGSVFARVMSGGKILDWLSKANCV